MCDVTATRSPVNPNRPRPVRNPRPKPVARPRLILAPADGLPGIFIVRDEKGITSDYEFSRQPADWGIAYRVEKMLFGERGPEYDTLLDVENGEAGHHICSCPGHERYGYCRHVRALLTFHQTGQLTCELSVPPSPFASINRENIPF